MQYAVIVDIDISDPIILSRHITYNTAQKAAVSACRSHRNKAVIVDLCLNMLIKHSDLQSVTDKTIITWIKDQITKNNPR